MGGIGIRELLIVLVVALVIFGTKKLRSIGSDLGAAVRGFKKAVNDGEQEENNPKQLGADAEFPETAKKPEAEAKKETEKA
jgi:sec-independent protein translocase protein TatA